MNDEKKNLHLTPRILYTLQQFMKIEASGGILLFFFTVVAIVWANSPWAEIYEYNGDGGRETTRFQGLSFLRHPLFFP
jgi:hypothetical protein